GGDDLDLAPLAPGDQRCLGGHAVDAVDHRVELFGDVLGHGLAGDEISHRMDLAGRIDGADACRHLVDLGLAHGALNGMHLPVGVGDADVVQVEQRDLAHAGTGQCFGGPGTDTADTDHCHMRGGQALQPCAPVEPGNTAEALFVCHRATLENRPTL